MVVVLFCFPVDLLQETPDVRRIKWEQRWMPRYFYQHVYVPMLYCLVSVHVCVCVHACTCVGACVCVLYVRMWW